MANDKFNQQPAEGDRETVERELKKQDRKLPQSDPNDEDQDKLGSNEEVQKKAVGATKGLP